MSTVWIFNGTRNYFPSAVFTRREEAVKWIKNNNLVGALTEYPVDQPAYDWAIEEGFFEVKRPHQAEADFIANFSCASQAHEHFGMDDDDF